MVRTSGQGLALVGERSEQSRQSRAVSACGDMVLDATADADRGDPRDRLRAKVAAAGMLHQVPTTGYLRAAGVVFSTPLVASAPIADQLLADERNGL